MSSPGIFLPEKKCFSPEDEKSEIHKSMKLKAILKVVAWGISAGFIFGLGEAIQVIFSHRYFHYGLYRLILFELTGNINRCIAYGLIAAILFVLLMRIAFFIWRKFLSPFFEIRVIKKNELTPLVKGFCFGLIFVYLLLQILKFARSANPKIELLLGQSLIVFCLFFLFLRLEKIDSRVLRAGISSFFKSPLMKKALLTVLAVFIVVDMVSFGQKLFQRPSGPNVLLIVADALRADHLGCYGYGRPISPCIDKFAAESLVFEEAWSNSPWTKPSMGTVFTSLFPHEHQAFYWTDDLPDECLTLAEVFRNRNYATFVMQTNPSISEKHNFKQGFQYYQERIQEKGEIVTSAFLSWLKKHRKKPFLAYLHYMDTHVPYDAPQEFSQIFGLEEDSTLNPGQFKTFDIRVLGEIGLSPEDKHRLVNLYDGAVKYFDNNFETIVDNLKKLRISNKTIIILTSDHGEEFWEHDGFAHGHSLYNELLRVPLIIGFPSHLPAKRIKSRVQLLDLFPTILETARIDNNFELRGKQLLSPALNNKRIDDEAFIEAILFGAEKKGVVKGRWKLIENTGEKKFDTFETLGDLTKYRYPEYKKGFELYNIDQDSSEKNNLINEYPQIANELKKLLLKFRTTSLVFSPQKKTKLKEKLEDLKSLGYIR